MLAFEAAARHGSFSLAARELVVTEGAVSRQVARLEAFLRVPLFARGGNRVELTAHGAHYAEEVGRLLASLEQSTLQVMTTPSRKQMLELAVIGTFATKWLIPRLPSFTRAHADIVINLSTRNDPFVLDGTAFDAAIAFAHPAWAGNESRHLFRSALIPVCRPDLVLPSRRRDGTVLSTLPLLHKTATPESWPDYAREFGIDLQNATAGGRFEQFSMLIEAALAGLGVALVPYLYVADGIRSGELIPLGPPGRDTGKDFIFVTGATTRQPDLLGEFSNWLVREATSDAPPLAAEDSISPRT
ncbi:LysR family transcriptional regulator [Planosporangium thailandense]|uniref:LysR family transcriptional regulator n=2 Tax=Planosporangium thailandense TaxID=765197 RepID=A0ABX0XW60_9ACTN|nr:LysR family transcriptional regulator [Planosporangium thailandense]